jgi:hypothetical protein
MAAHHIDTRPQQRHREQTMIRLFLDPEFRLVVGNRVDSTGWTCNRFAKVAHAVAR